MSHIGSFQITTNFEKPALKLINYFGDAAVVIENSKKLNLIDNILGTSMTIKHLEGLIYSVPSDITIEDLQLLATSDISENLQNYSSLSDEDFLYKRFTTLGEHNGTRLSSVNLFLILLKSIFNISISTGSIYNKAGIVLILPHRIENSIVSNANINMFLKKYTTNVNDFVDEVIALGFTNEAQNHRLELIKNQDMVYKIRHSNLGRRGESSKWYFLLKGLYTGNLKNAVIGAMGIFADRNLMYKYYLLMALTISVKDETLPLIYYLLSQAKDAYNFADDYEHDVAKYVALVEVVFYAPKSNKLISVMSNNGGVFYSLMNEEIGKGEPYDYNEQDDPISREIKELYKDITDESNEYAHLPKTLIDVFVKNQYPTSNKNLEDMFTIDPHISVDYRTKLTIFDNFIKRNIPEQFRDFIINGASNRGTLAHTSCLFMLCTEMLCNDKVTPAGLAASSNTDQIVEKINERVEFNVNDPGRRQFMSSVITFSLNRNNDFVSMRNDGFFRRYEDSIIEVQFITDFLASKILPKSVENDTFRIDPENFSYLVRNTLLSSNFI
jgi:hypothetical protein